MIIELSKQASKKEVTAMLQKATTKKQGNLKKYFGANKNGIDGLAFQKKVRAEWE